MKNILFIILCFGFGILAIYEQSKPEPNKLIMFLAFAIFVFGLYKLMRKIPNKDSENNEE